MHLDVLRDYCLAKHGATEDMPFGPDVLAFKVRGKMFALTNLEKLPRGVALKCDPERVHDLRERFDGVTTAPHFNKVHWNLVSLASDVPGALIRELIDHSYALVVAGLTRKERASLVAQPAPEASGDT